MSFVSMTSETDDHTPGNIVAFEPESTRDRVRRAFSQRLTDLRLNFGWSQAELGRHSGIKRDLINAYSKGRTLPTDVNLQALARALKTTPENLIPKNTAQGQSSESGMLLSYEIPKVPSINVAYLPNGKWRVRADVVLSDRAMNEVLRLIRDDEQTSDAE
jgi:transcriptional regulator with XRE-family HTH domain